MFVAIQPEDIPEPLSESLGQQNGRILRRSNPQRRTGYQVRTEVQHG